jgi:hypothetical protein
MYDYIATLLADAAAVPVESDNELEFELAKIRLISQARVVLDIIEAQSVHTLRSSLPQPSYGDIGEAQGISKQEATVRAIRDAAARRVHQDRVRDLSAAARARYADVLERLGR